WPRTPQQTHSSNGQPMTSNLRLAATTLAASALLVGCVPADPVDTGKTPETTPVAETSPSPEAEASEFGKAEYSVRGNLIKQVGQLAGTSSLASNVTTSRFAVTDLVLDRACTSGFADPPANGHYLAIHLNVE